jgi:hypothetical protein
MREIAPEDQDLAIAVNLFDVNWVFWIVFWAIYQNCLERKMSEVGFPCF